MTMSVKLPLKLEQQLRRRGAALGQSISTIIREALSMYPASRVGSELSAYALEADLFGHHSGSSDLATSRKAAAADVWQKKHAARRA